MKNNKYFLFTILLLTSLYNLKPQNLLRYETQVISIVKGQSTSTPFGGTAFQSITVDIGRFVLDKANPSLPNVKTIAYELNNDAPYNTIYSKITPFSLSEAIQLISNSLGNSGYSLKSVAVTQSPPFLGHKEESISLIYEKSTSYREEELYKLLGVLNSKIESTSKNYIEKAKTEINQNVLEYLKGIPDEVLAKSFKEELLKNLSFEIDDKLKKMKEEIILELKKP